MIKSFPKIWSLGSKEVESVFTGPVEVTEKIDGSQFSFGRTEEGEFVMRSKGQQIYKESADKLFKPVVDYVLSIEQKIDSGFTFYGETLARPKHNTLAYQRVPKNNLAIFAANVAGLWTSDWQTLVNCADGLGVDVVPLIYAGEIADRAMFDKLIERESYLGGAQVEGVVVKNYGQLAKSAFSRECYAKFVRAEFKEMNGKNFPTRKDRMEEFYEYFRSEARWAKAVQHLREAGKLTESPADIGALIAEVRHDLEQEQKETIKERLWTMFSGDVIRRSTRGLPEWYKKEVFVDPFFKVAGQ